MIVEQGAWTQWDVPQAIGAVLKDGNYDPVVFQDFTSNLLKMATQSSSHSCPMDMSETVVMSLKTWEDCALEESLLKSCKVALKDGLRMFLLATCTVGPDVVCAAWEKFGQWPRYRVVLLT